MSKFKFNKFLSLFILLPITAFAGTTQHDNQFCLKYGSIQFGLQTPNATSTVVAPSTYIYTKTNGQPWSGVENAANGCIIVKSGRSNDSSNVNWVKTQLANIGPIGTDGKPLGITLNKNTAYTGKGYDDTPSKLNFAIKGLLIVTLNTVEYKCPDFMIGQGHTSAKGVYNNWWGFQNYYGATGKHTVQCLDPYNNPVIFSAKIDGEKTLVLNQIAG